MAALYKRRTVCRTLIEYGASVTRQDTEVSRFTFNTHFNSFWIFSKHSYKTFATVFLQHCLIYQFSIFFFFFFFPPNWSIVEFFEHNHTLFLATLLLVLILSQAFLVFFSLSHRRLPVIRIKPFVSVQVRQSNKFNSTFLWRIKVRRLLEGDT